MPTAFLQSLQLGPGFWTFSLGAVGALCSFAGTLWLARYRFRLNFYKAETERQLGLCEHEASMFTRETDRQQMLLEAALQRDFMLRERRQIEIDLPLKRGTRRAQISAAETQGA